jgi:UDP-glucuronate 4-epimerase
MMRKKISSETKARVAIEIVRGMKTSVPYRIYNIGSSSPVRLMDYIETLEETLGKKAIKEFLPMQPGDVLNTSCDVSDLEKDFGYRPKTTLKEGPKSFADWYKSYYHK